MSLSLNWRALDINQMLLCGRQQSGHLRHAGFFACRSFSAGEGGVDIRGCHPHERRFTTVSERENFIRLTAGRVIDHPAPRTTQPMKREKRSLFIKSFHISNSAFSEMGNFVWRVYMVYVNVWHCDTGHCLVVFWQCQPRREHDGEHNGRMCLTL